MDAKEAIARFFCKAARGRKRHAGAITLSAYKSDFHGAVKIDDQVQPCRRRQKPVLEARGALESAVHTRGRSGKGRF